MPARLRQRSYECAARIVSELDRLLGLATSGFVGRPAEDGPPSEIHIARRAALMHLCPISASLPRKLCLVVPSSYTSSSYTPSSLLLLPPAFPPFSLSENGDLVLLFGCCSSYAQFDFLMRFSIATRRLTLHAEVRESSQAAGQACDGDVR